MSQYDTETRRQALVDVLSSLKELVIEPDALDLDDAQALGRGGYGDVQLVSMRTPDGPSRQVAVKTLFPSEGEEIRLALRFAREVKLWAQLNHPNVLSLLGFFMQLEEPQWLYCVSSFSEEGDLSACLNQNPDTDELLRFQWAFEVTQGLKYLHTLKPSPIVHGDLKPENVLLQGSTPRAVLCDFGLSQIAGGPSETGLTTSDGFKGTLPWCSPELLTSNAPRTRGSDMWACALLILFIMTGIRPFRTETSPLALMQRIASGRHPKEEDYPSFLHAEDVWDTLRSCLVANPDDRLPVEGCLIKLDDLYVPYQLMPYIESIPFEDQVWKIDLMWSFDALHMRPNEIVHTGDKIVACYGRWREYSILVAYDLASGRHMWHMIDQFTEYRIAYACSEDMLAVAYPEFWIQHQTMVEVRRIRNGVVEDGPPSVYRVGFPIEGILFDSSDLLVWGSRNVSRIVNLTKPSAEIVPILKLEPRRTISHKPVISPGRKWAAVVTETMAMEAGTTSHRITVFVPERIPDLESGPPDGGGPSYATEIEVEDVSSLMWLSDIVIAAQYLDFLHLYDVNSMPHISSWTVELPHPDPLYGPLPHAAGHRAIQTATTWVRLADLLFVPGRLLSLDSLMEEVEQRPHIGEFGQEVQPLPHHGGPRPQLAFASSDRGPGLIHANDLVVLQEIGPEFDWDMPQCFVGRITRKDS